jgi:hypothetical protein
MRRVIEDADVESLREILMISRRLFMDASI